jgi:hypothetical protein
VTVGLPVWTVLPYMTAAIARYGGAALAPILVTDADSREALGRRLLRELDGHRTSGQPIPAPLADLIAKPADAAALDAFKSYVVTMKRRQPGTYAVICELVSDFCGRRAAVGDVRAMADLGEILRWQKDFSGARVAYQQAIDAGYEHAAIDLGKLLADVPGSGDAAVACLRRAAASGDRAIAAEGGLELGAILWRRGDANGGQAAYLDVIGAGPPELAAARPRRHRGNSRRLPGRGRSGRRGRRLRPGHRGTDT